MRSRLPILFLLLAASSGCSTAPPHHPTSPNPFDEVGQLSAMRDSASLLHASPARKSDKRVVTKRGHALKPAQPVPTTPSHVVVFTPPPPGLAAQKALVLPEYQDDTSHTVEMIAEANRIGSLGDARGKADLLMQAGYSGDAQAFYELARMYQDGQLPKDETAMVGYLTQAQSMGSVEASRVLGHLYVLGHGVPSDAKYGRQLLAEAAKTSIRAAREYGLMLTNQRQPYLNDIELGLSYLQSAASRGDADAAHALAMAFQEAGRDADALVALANAETLGDSGAVQVSGGSTGAATTSRPLTIKERAMRGDPSAAFDFAQQVLIRKIPTSDPMFTGYCWLSVAEKLGHPKAKSELSLIQGVRYTSDRDHPGRMDQCISDLHYQITGHE